MFLMLSAPLSYYCFSSTFYASVRI